MVRRLFAQLIFPAAFLFLSKNAYAILTPQVDSITMSDGKKLAADIYKPTGITQGPVILIQTPYNRLLYRFGLPLQIGQNINSSNYIIVIVDWRGFYGSVASKYVGQPALGQDGYSCVEWIAAQSWSNGKIGTWGPSALGKVQFQTAQNNPPHLTCICPLVAGPQFDYTDFYPNGCLRTEYVDQLDALGFGYQPTLTMHPVHDATWTFLENANYYPASIQVPCFMIGGWYDHNIQLMLPFFSGIRNSSPIGVRDKHRLLMGPWVHGGHSIANVGSATQGQLSYANATKWSDSLAYKFFDFYLRNISNSWDESPFVQYYQMGDNTWKSDTQWPPSGLLSTTYYMHPGGLLDISIPPVGTDNLSFNYDPTDPSPTVGGPTLRTDLDQGPYDQSIVVESRSDILVFTSDLLLQNVEVKGNVVAHLKVSSDKKDADFVVRLTDVYPDGRSMLVNTNVKRMRFRNGNNAADTAALIPGQVYDCTISLPATANTFLAGHKIRVDISSSNYPQFNRNMNTDGAMYPNNNIDTLVNPVTATNTVYLNATNASYFTFPIATVVLPVKLSTFTAALQGENVLLKWSMATNIDIKHFTIEKSIDESIWTEIDKSNAINTPGSNDYSSIDNDPVNGINYYRIRIVNKDGSYTYSQVRAVVVKNKIPFTIAPNPASTLAAIIFKENLKDAQLSVFDAQGKKIYTAVLNGQAGSSYQLQTNKFLAGTYTVQIKGAGNSYTEKLVISK